MVEKRNIMVDGKPSRGLHSQHRDAFWGVVSSV